MTLTTSIKKICLAQTPAKIILFGEHSVLYGSKCISLTVKKYGRVYAIKGTGKIICKDNCGNLVTLNENFEFKFVNIDVIIELDIPLGGGMGSSAIICLLISAMISINDNEIIPEKEKTTEGMTTVPRRAINLENIFHGKSSGTDVISSYYGGIICYQDKLIRRIEGSGIRDYKVIIWNSKIKKRTSDALRSKNSIHQRLAEITEEAYEILSGKFTLKEFYALVRRSQDCLEELVLVPEEMKKEIRRLRKMNIESKVSGSGNGGHLVTLIRKDESILGWEEVEIDYEGFVLKNKTII